MPLLTASHLYVLLDDAPIALPDDVLVFVLPTLAPQTVPDLIVPLSGDLALLPPPIGPTVAPAAAIPTALAFDPPVAAMPAAPAVNQPASTMTVVLAFDPPARTITTTPTVDPPAASPTPAIIPPPEDAFPSLAALDAILAAHAGPPAGPDADERAAAAALLGLDPSVAADPLLYAETLAGLPDPDADAVLEAWLAEAEAEAGPPPPAWPDPSGDWQVG